MTDNKTNRGKQDRIRIDSKDPSEVEYVHRKFPHLTHEQVVACIKKAGPYRDDVVKCLQEIKK